MAKTSSFPLKAAMSLPAMSRPHMMSTAGKASSFNHDFDAAA